MTEQMPPVSKDKLARIMRQVQALLAKADSTEFEEEAKTYRAKAEQFMREYRIAEESLIAEDQATIVPEWAEVEFGSKNPKMQQAYVNFLHDVAQHAEVRVYAESRWDPKRDHRMVNGRLCGYSGDLLMAQFLFNSVRLAFAEAMEPQVRPDMTDQQNVYRLRQAGIERWRIAQTLWGSDPRDGSAHGKVAKLYKAECAERGIDATVSGRNVNAKTYREAYTESFRLRLHRRLREARDAADTAGGALVLAGRSERVNEEFYAKYPRLRPSTDVAHVEEACQRCKKNGGHCRSHPKARWTKADEARYQRLYNSDAALAGRMAGESAADQVELSRPARAQRIEPGDEGRAEMAINEILGR